MHQTNHLQCEHLQNPLGIETNKPRFSWQLKGNPCSKGLAQSAYHVLVATSQEQLKQATGDLWDSGKIESDQSVLVKYAGVGLSSNQSYYWMVKTWDEQGQMSDWSEPASFSVGLLQPNDWKGTWIQAPNVEETQHLWFKKEISLDAPMQDAFLYLASSGYHELYVNGHRVDDRVLAPTTTRMDKRIHYITYKLDKLLLVGSNTILIHYGPGWSRFSYFKEKGTISAIQAQFYGTYMKKNRLDFTTDSKWHYTKGYSFNIGGCQYDDNGGELIDGRLLKKSPLHNIENNSWLPVKTVNWDIQLTSDLTNPSRVFQKLTPISVKPYKKGFKIDFGFNFTGFFRAYIKGQQQGDIIKFTLVEANEETPRSYQQYFVYICNGNEHEQFGNRFNYACGRYLIIEGLKNTPECQDLLGLPISNDFRRTGIFHSSNKLFNKMYEVDLWTYIINTIEGYTVDCPHRERMGYGEVHTATSWGIGLPNFDSNAFYSRVVNHWADVQMENGWFHHTAPHINEHFGGPMWSSAGISVASAAYTHTGDVKYIHDIYEHGKRWIAFLNSNIENGVLKNYAPDDHRMPWGLYLGDWAAPGEREERGDSIEAEYFNNCVFCMNLIDLIRMAKVLGKSDDVQEYEQQLQALRNNIHTTYFNEELITYGGDTQIHLAFALLVDLVPSEYKEAIKNRIKEHIDRLGYLDMGSSGLPVLLKYFIDNTTEALWLYDSFDKKDIPSYGYFLERGETAWPEYWCCERPSRVHTCYTGVASWFIKALGGIRPNPLKPGYQNFIIQPSITNRLEYVDAQTESPYGIIRSSWQIKNDVTLMEVEIPANSQADVYIPSNQIDKIFIDSQAIDTNQVEVLKDSTVVQLPAGIYKIEIKQ
ncbi:MAG: glycoside hydrolase family 78 protein [Lentisphaeria bacterium]|nr:glycoside hydrolase family 78 protein [Lentisphaeria bacterium]